MEIVTTTAHVTKYGNATIRRAPLSFGASDLGDFAGCIAGGLAGSGASGFAGGTCGGAGPLVLLLAAFSDAVGSGVGGGALPVHRPNVLGGDGVRGPDDDGEDIRDCADGWTVTCHDRMPHSVRGERWGRRRRLRDEGAGRRFNQGFNVELQSRFYCRASIKVLLSSFNQGFNILSIRMDHCQFIFQIFIF